jgi:hypothetical protein
LPRPPLFPKKCAKNPHTPSRIHHITPNSYDYYFSLLRSFYLPLYGSDLPPRFWQTIKVVLFFPR